MLLALGGALAGYGYASGRKGLLVAGVLVVVGLTALNFAAMNAMRGMAPK